MGWFNRKKERPVSAVPILGSINKGSHPVLAEEKIQSATNVAGLADESASRNLGHFQAEDDAPLENVVEADHVSQKTSVQESCSSKDSDGLVSEADEKSGLDWTGGWLGTDDDNESDPPEPLKCYQPTSDHGDSGAKLALLKIKAEEGDHLSQYLLGLAFAKGDGVAADSSEALKWLRLASRGGYRLDIPLLAELGNGQAQYQLGNLYRFGTLSRSFTGTPDYEQAVKWYQRAAEQNLPTAQFALGECYRDGHGVVSNIAIAREWYKKASLQGYLPALQRLLDTAPAGQKQNEPIGTLFRKRKRNAGGFNDIIIDGDKWHRGSPLTAMGYHVGESSDLRRDQRADLLEQMFKGRLVFPTGFSEDEQEGWGQPGSAARLQKIATHIAKQIALRSMLPNYDVAVSEWQEDLAWLKEEFYEPLFRFRWPA